MDIALTQRLSFKQAAMTVLVAFILGTLLSIVQVAVDYASEDASINREIGALMQISHDPAARIAFNIDAELAQELIAGLLRSPAVIKAELVDSSGLVLARQSRPPEQSTTRIFSDSLFGAQRVFQDILYVAHSPDALGTLRLEIDTYAFGSDFLYRSMLTFVTGCARSLLLSLILLVLFYVMLTKPLKAVIRALTRRGDPASQYSPIPCPSGHERDEIGILVEATNQQLSNVAQEVEQRRHAEDQLTQYLAQLENIVSARTAELKATNARLSYSNRELEQARTTAMNMAQARSAFLANMSHEIRTPLNGLLGMLALALDGPLSDEQRQQLGIAHDSGKVLVELLNDILDLSKFEAGQLELEKIPFDIGVLAEETASLLSQNAANGVELTCLIDPRLPAQVKGDPTRVRQIISNLLSNALKFTRAGHVELCLCPTTEGVAICVNDTGIGIAEHAQARIFQPFTQAGADITREFGGTGLGLALTRRLCEAMQGRLSFKSKEGEGSQFYAHLPLPPVSHAPARQNLSGTVAAVTTAQSGLDQLLSMWLPEWGLSYQRADCPHTLNAPDISLWVSETTEPLSALRPGSIPIILVSHYGDFLGQDDAKRLAPLAQLARPLTRDGLLKALNDLLVQGNESRIERRAHTQRNAHSAKVLLVEDNPVNQMVAKGMLAKLGCEVILAEHGAAALERLHEYEVDLVLMDCNMPVMDGYEATRHIRRHEAWQNLPIIALTANVLSDERERCRAAGMNDYLAKPFRREELAGLLETWLRRQRRDD